MAHIVILGAGIGGMPAAYEARELLGKEHQVTVINAVDYFQFVPSNPWVAVGWRTRDEITFPIEPYLKRKGIDFIASAVNKIDADQNTLHLDNGNTVKYDYLIITTGPKLNFGAIEGGGPHGGHTQSVCTVDHSEQAYQDFQKLCENPGPVIVGAFQGASCYGPAYEYVFILDAALRKKKLRDKVPMFFVTAEPYIGHLGLGGVGDSKGMLEAELRMHDIKWICNARTTKVEAGKMHVEELDMQGNVVKTHELPFNHSMMLPPFRGVDAVAALGEGAVNPGGFVLIDEHQRNPKFKNIYSAGVCVAIPPVEATPVPVGAPKTGYMLSLIHI